MTMTPEQRGELAARLHALRGRVPDDVRDELDECARLVLCISGEAYGLILSGLVSMNTTGAPSHDH